MYKSGFNKLQQPEINTHEHPPLKILIIYDCIYPESLGGVEHRNYHLALALAKRGHQVTLVGWCEQNHSLSKNVQVVSMAFRARLYNETGKRNITTSLKFAAATMMIDLKQFDIVETASIPYVHLFPLWLSCLLFRKPLVVTWIEYWGNYWSEYVGKLKAPLFMLIEWLSSQLGKKVSANSLLTAERVQANRLRGDKVYIIPCGVYLEDILAVRQQVQYESLPLIYAGRLVREKRVDLLLEALTFINLPNCPNLLTIVGDGPDRQRLENIAHQLAISDKVHFLGRLPSNLDVWREMARSKVAIQPSSREGFGLFPLEAMALGLPVIYCKSSESAISALVRDRVEGICAEANPQSLAQAIEELLTDNYLREQYSKNAIQRSQDYDWMNIAEKMETLFYKSLRNC